MLWVRFIFHSMQVSWGRSGVRCRRWHHAAMLLNLVPLVYPPFCGPVVLAEPLVLQGFLPVCITSFKHLKADTEYSVTYCINLLW